MVGRTLQRSLRASGRRRYVAGLVGWHWYGEQLFAGCAECLALVAPWTARKGNVMDVLYILVPLSVVLVFFIIGGVWWAIHRGQFDDIEQEGERILKDG